MPSLAPCPRLSSSGRVPEPRPGAGVHANSHPCPLPGPAGGSDTKAARCHERRAGAVVVVLQGGQPDPPPDRGGVVRAGVRGEEPGPLHSSPNTRGKGEVGEQESRSPGVGIVVGPRFRLRTPGAVSPAPRIDAAPRRGLIRVLERPFDRFLVILLFPGSRSEDDGIGV